MMSEKDLSGCSVKKNVYLEGIQSELNATFCVIQTGAELLERQVFRVEDPELSEKMHQTISAIRSSLLRAERLTRYAMDILLGCVDMLEPCMTWVELRQMLCTSAEIIQEELSKRRADEKIEIRIPKESIWIQADDGYLSQILSILLANAWRMTQGGVLCEVIVEEGPVLCVRDNGPQISQSVVDAVENDSFEESMEKADLVGMPLYLARLYCTAMDWTMKVTSNETCTEVRVFVKAAAQPPYGIAGFQSASNLLRTKLRSALQRHFPTLFSG